MGKYIFLLLCGIVFIAIIFFGSRLLCIYVRKPLVEYCNKRGLSASPWLTLIPVVIGVCMLDEYRMNTGHSWSELWQNAPDEQLPLAVFLFGGIGLIALPMIILLIRAKKKFLWVLLIKILCVPLDIFYVVHYCMKKIILQMELRSQEKHIGMEDSIIIPIVSKGAMWMEKTLIRRVL